MSSAALARGRQTPRLVGRAIDKEIVRSRLGTCLGRKSFRRFVFRRPGPHRSIRSEKRGSDRAQTVPLPLFSSALQSMFAGGARFRPMWDFSVRQSRSSLPLLTFTSKTAGPLVFSSSVPLFARPSFLHPYRCSVHPSGYGAVALGLGDLLCRGMNLIQSHWNAPECKNVVSN